MASKRWCNPAARRLLAELQSKEARKTRWDNTPSSSILAKMNDALRNVYDAQQTVPQSILLLYSSYMILRGYTRVKLGRRHHKWVKS